MKNLILVLAALTSTLAYANSNGSSGIGNAIPVDPDLKTTLPGGYVKPQGTTLVDAKTGEPLIATERVAKSAITDLGDSVIHAQLGSVQGFEYVPTIGSTEQNYWFVCAQNRGDCLKLTPLTRTNPKAPAIIGALGWKSGSAPTSQSSQ